MAMLLSSQSHITPLNFMLHLLTHHTSPFTPLILTPFPHSSPRPQSANYDSTSGLFSKEELKNDEKKKSKEQLYTRVNKLPTTVKVPEGPRKMFVFRHSERVDVTFGKQWIDNSFDPQGKMGEFGEWSL